jgi:hypothetical protein
LPGRDSFPGVSDTTRQVVRSARYVMLRAIVFRRFSGALVFALVAASPLLAQQPPLSLCLVQTKPDAATQYNPSAGAWAIELDKLLSAQRLRSGAPLQITVLAASVEKDIQPEVRRLHCPYVVKLSYQGGLSPVWRYAKDAYGDSLLFSLSNGPSEKIIAQGASPIRLIHGQDRPPPSPLVSEPVPCAAVTQQIMKSLNKLP